MSRFAYVLRRLEAELASPEPWRTRTLLEIGGDLEEAYDAYRSRGLSEAESAERAAALLGVNREVAGELSGLNSPRYAGWLMRLAQRRGRWESAVATLVTVGTVAGGAVALQGGALFRTPGFALLLACALGAALLWSAGAVVVNAFGARRRAQVEERLASLLLLAAVAVTAGSVSSLWIVWRSGVNAAGGTTLVEMLVAVGQAAELLTLAFGIAACALLAWFHLSRRLARLWQMQAELQRLMGDAKEAA